MFFDLKYYTFKYMSLHVFILSGVLFFKENFSYQLAILSKVAAKI